MTVQAGMKREVFQIKNIHPVAQHAFTALAARCRKKIFEHGPQPFAFMPFEGFRHPERQHHLLTVEKTTKARPWQSPHQYGLAVDFAACRVEKNMIVPNTWLWPDAADLCWDELKRMARAEGLDIPIQWDRGHVVHPLYNEVRTALHRREWNWLA